MKKKWYILLLAVTFVLFSCKSKPETYTEVGESVPSDTGSTSSASGTTNTTTQTKPTETTPKADPAKASAESEIKKAETSLTEVNKTDVAKLFPTEFASAKADITAAKNAANSGNYSQAKTQATKANTKLQTLLNLSKANTVKNDITTNTFEGTAPKEFSNAEIAYIKATENYGKNDNQALTYSKTALQNYERVLTSGYTNWTNIAMEGAVKAKAQCDSITANKALPTEYKAAEDLLKKARTAQTKKDYLAAYAAFNEANEKYTSIFDRVSTLRAEALTAMEKASARQELSSELAAEADIIRPLTETDIIETGVQNIPEIQNAPTDTGLGN